MTVNVGGILFDIQAELRDALQGIDVLVTKLGAIEDAAKKTKDEVENLGSSTTMLERTVGALAFALGGLGLGSLAKFSAEYAARVETLGIVLENVGKNAGYSQEQIHSLENGIKSLGITTEVARTSMAQMIQAELDLTKAVELARGAQDAAVISGMDSSATFERLQYAISNLDTMSLRYMGVLVSLAQAEEKYAAANNKTVKSLTIRERQEALMAEVLRKLTLLQGTYESAMETAGKQMTSMVRLWNEAYNELGKQFQPILRAHIKLISDLLKIYAETTDTTKILTAATVAFGAALLSLIGVAKTLTVVLGALGVSMKLLGAATPALTALTLVIAGLAAAYVALSAAQEKAAVRYKELELDARTSAYEAKQLSKLTEEFEALARKQDRTSEEQDRYNELIGKLAALEPRLLKILKDKNLALEDQLRLLQGITGEKERQAQLDAEEADEARVERLVSLQNERERIRSTLEGTGTTGVYKGRGALNFMSWREVTGGAAFPMELEEFLAKARELNVEPTRSARTRYNDLIERWRSVQAEIDSIIGDVTSEEDRLRQVRETELQDYIARVRIEGREIIEEMARIKKDKLDLLRLELKERLDAMDSEFNEMRQKEGWMDAELEELTRKHEERKQTMRELYGKREIELIDSINREVRDRIMEVTKEKLALYREDLTAQDNALDEAKRIWDEWQRMTENIQSFLRREQLSLIGEDQPGRAGVMRQFDIYAEALKDYARTVEDVNDVLAMFQQTQDAALKSSQRRVVDLQRDMKDLEYDWRQVRKNMPEQYNERWRRIAEDETLSAKERYELQRDLVIEFRRERDERVRSYRETKQHLEDQIADEQAAQEEMARTATQMFELTQQRARELAEQQLVDNQAVEESLLQHVTLEQEKLEILKAESAELDEQGRLYSQLLTIIQSTEVALAAAKGAEGAFDVGAVGPAAVFLEAASLAQSAFIDTLQSRLTKGQELMAKLVGNTTDMMAMFVGDIDVRIEMVEAGLARLEAIESARARRTSGKKAAQGVS